MDRHSKPPARYRVDDLLVDTGTHRISRGGIAIDLTKRSYDLLLALIEAAPNLLTNDELLEKVWPDRIVGQETVTQRVKLVRDAIGDDPGNPRYIKAIWGEGYRLRARVQRLRSGPSRWQTSLSRQRCPEKSIAILPFRNIDDSSKTDFFAYGIAESVMHALANMRDVHVIARTSSFAYGVDSTDAREIGGGLNVRYLLEGSVQRSGSLLRVFAQLIDASDGAHVWSVEHQLNITNEFECQDEISSGIIAALMDTLSHRPAQDSR